MKRLKTFGLRITVLILLITQYGATYADENISLVYFADIGITGLSFDPSTTDLQVKSLRENNFEGQYDLSTKNDSFFTGIGVGRHEKNLVSHIDGSQTNFDSYALVYNFYYLKFGYDIQFEKSRLKPSLKIGNGNYTFRGSNNTSESGSATMFGAECNYESKILDTSFSYLIGLGYSESNFKSVNGLSGWEVTKPIASINLGLAYSF